MSNNSVSATEIKPRNKPPLKVSTYTPERGAEIIAAIASGSSVEKAVAGICSHTTFFTWLRENPALLADYARARERRADARAERIDGICEQVASGELDPAAARVMIDAIKWQCAHELPNRYGDKLTQEISGPGGAPVATTHSIVFVAPAAVPASEPLTIDTKRLLEPGE